MTKKHITNINSEAVPVLTGKVDNRGGQILGRRDKHYSKNIADQAKSQKREHRTQIIVAIIGAVAIIIAAIIKALLNV